MKAIIELNLPEEELEHNQCSNAVKLAEALFEIDQWARNAILFGHEFTTIVDVLKEVRRKIDDVRDIL